MLLIVNIFDKLRTFCYDLWPVFKDQEILKEPAQFFNVQQESDSCFHLHVFQMCNINFNVIYPCYFCTEFWDRGFGRK